MPMPTEMFLLYSLKHRYLQRSRVMNPPLAISSACLSQLGGDPDVGEAVGKGQGLGGNGEGIGRDVTGSGGRCESGTVITLRMRIVKCCR